MLNTTQEIVTFDMLIYPFDYPTWYFTIGFTAGTLIVLFLFQKAWQYASGEPNPDDWVFQGK